MAAESKLERECRKLAEANGMRLLKWVSPGVNGVPDRILLGPQGYIRFIEFKAPEGRLSPGQRRWIRWLTDRSHYTHVVRRLHEFRDLMP